MGNIKDLIDLAKDLESRAKDRKDIDTLRAIVSLTHSIQAQHAEVVERDVRVMQDNAKLVAKNTELERQLAEAQAEEICIHRGIEFRRGKRTRNQWLGFCPKCHMPAHDTQITKAVNFKKVIVPTISCTTDCGWQIFEKLRLGEIAAELPADVMPNKALQRTAAPPSA